MFCTIDGGSSDESDTESLLLTVESLKAQLQEQTKLCKEQVSHLLQSCYYKFWDCLAVM